MRFTLLHRSGFDIEKSSSYPPFPLDPVLRISCRGVQNSECKNKTLL